MERRLTRADLAAQYDQPGIGKRMFELIRGQIFELPTYTALYSWVITQLTFKLQPFVRTHNLGLVYTRIQIDLPNGDSPVTSACFISHQTHRGIPETYTVAPDLVIRMVMPDDSVTKIRDYIDSFLSSGSHRVWLVYPERRVIEVFRRLGDRSTAYETYRIGDTVTGEGVLEGFTLPVADVFPKQPESSGQPPATSRE